MYMKLVQKVSGIKYLQIQRWSFNRLSRAKVVHEHMLGGSRNRKLSAQLVEVDVCCARTLSLFPSLLMAIQKFPYGQFFYQIDGTDDALNFSARAYGFGLWSRLHLEHLFIDRHFKSKQDIFVFVLALEVTSRSSTIFMCYVWTAPSAVFGFICHLRILRRKPTAPKPPASKPMPLPLLRHQRLQILSKTDSVS
jgi:hypothetical protein